MITKTLSIPPNLPLSSPKSSHFPQSHLQFLFSLKFPSSTPHRRPQFLRTQIPQCQNPSNPSPPAPQPQPQPQQNRHLKDTQEAISKFLLDFGISADDSDSISSNCPKYALMLIDSVKDLEEWNACTKDTPAEEFGQLSFKDKVIYMAKDKGDCGKIALLENLGLSLSSAINVARYLSTESLPSLVQKVKFMKDLFFSGSADKGIIGKSARRMMLHLSIPIDDDLQQTLSLFEKMEARRGGLDMLGVSDASFRYIVESFPHVLALPLDAHLKPMVELLETIGVPRERMGSIFLLFPPIILGGINSIKRNLLALEKIGVVDEDFAKMLLKYPWILSASIQDNYKEILSMCHVEKIPKVMIDKAIRSWPHLLGCSTSKLKVMVENFGALGIKNKKLGRVISRSPQLLLRKPQEFFQVVSFLRELGFDEETVGKILLRCPQIFGASVEKTLRRKVEFLASIGVSEDHLPRTIKKYPELLLTDINRTLSPRMKYLMEVGLSKNEIAFMVRKFSPLLGYSIDEVLRPKYEFLVNTMEKPVKEVVEYPRYFSYSLEKKIKPRFWVLKRMNEECSLKEMLDKNDDEFACKFTDRS
ncbi:transcription termination factor MTERF2, chloroplastic isoform X2 [Euphorbia lathyris]|uniref:transcription termination factor MTERF2, chloroplastic isoform X2 n=1 Tax=Euphorbia lathyris TaxID=212925 RepID=UPI00331316C6